VVEELGTALLLITHDMGVVASTCDEVNVLYGGKVVERTDRYSLFGRPRHPYSVGLLSSIPRLQDPPGMRLNPIPGSVADTLPWTSACAFAPRCANALPRCLEESPVLEIASSDPPHSFRCWNPQP